MTWSEIPWNPPARTLRQFAGLWIAFFGALAWVEGVRRGHPGWGLGLAILAGTVGPLGLAWPRAIRPIFVGWMVLAFPIGWTVSHLILAVLYYGLFTPLGLAFRLSGRDVLQRRLNPDRLSDWSPLPPPADPSSYFRQF